jgi:hypothetical protein
VVRFPVGVEIVAIGVVVSGRQRIERAGRQCIALVIDDPKRFDKSISHIEPFDFFVQAALIRPDGVGRHAFRDLIDNAQRESRRLKDIAGLLMKNAEFARNALFGISVDVVMSDPCRVAEQRDRQQQRSRHHHLEHTGGSGARRRHPSISRKK